MNPKDLKNSAPFKITATLGNHKWEGYYYHIKQAVKMHQKLKYHLETKDLKKYGF